MKSRAGFLYAAIWMFHLVHAFPALATGISKNPELRTPAQEKVITGKVTSLEGTPLPGVSISVKNTPAGTSTDGEGNYRISIPLDNVTLVFTSVGYKTAEIEAFGRTAINV